MSHVFGIFCELKTDVGGVASEKQTKGDKKTITDNLLTSFFGNTNMHNERMERYNQNGI